MWAHPQTESTWRTSCSSVLSFFISSKADVTKVLYFNKVLFFLLRWESGTSPADRSDRYCCWDKQPERKTDRQVPELSDSLKRPQQRYLLHCFWTFSFKAQWKINMNRPAERKKISFTVFGETIQLNMIKLSTHRYHHDTSPGFAWGSLSKWVNK